MIHKTDSEGLSSHEIHGDAALRPPLVSLLEGIDTDIDDISMDRTSDIIADGVAIAFYEDDAAKRDDPRIHGGMPLAGESAQRGVPFTAPVIGRVGRRSHVIGFRILAAEIRRIVQSIPDILDRKSVV